MSKAQKITVLLHVKYGKGMPNDKVEVSEEQAKTLLDGGFATEVKAVEEKVSAPTNAEIVAGLEDVADEDKDWLVEKLGDFTLELKVDKTLNAKSLKKIEEIFAEGDK